MRTHNVLLLGITMGIMVAVAGADSAQASTWNSIVSGGVWSDDTATGWNGTGVPNSNTATADFSTLNITNLTIVHLDGAYQVNKLLFGDVTTSDFGWELDNNGLSANILTMSGTAPTITVNNSRTATISAQLATASGVGFAKAGNGTLILSNGSTTASLTSGTTIFGTLRLDGGIYTGLGTVNVANSTANGTLTINNDTEFYVTATGADLLTQATSGNSTVGTININDSAVVQVKRNMRAGGDGGTNNRARGVINITGGTVDVGELILVRNSGDNNFGTGTLDITGGNVTGNELRIHVARQKGANVNVYVDTAGSLTVTNGVSYQHGTDSNVSTTGMLTINTGGTLRTSDITGVADRTNSKMRLALTGGTIVALQNHSAFITGFTVAPVIGAAGITFDSNGFDIEIPQNLQGASGKLTKVGLGTLTLSGNNTYGGQTIVSNGTLVVNGTTGAGMITVVSDATLGGSGTISGATTIAGTHTPGNSPGSQTFAAGLTYESGSSLVWELASNTAELAERGAITGYDAINVTGGNLSIDSNTTLSLVFNASGSTVNWNDSFWASEHEWLMIDYGGAGTSLGDFENITVTQDSAGNSLAVVRAGAGFSQTRVGDDVYVSYIIPEPATAGMLLLGMVGMALRRRQKTQLA